MMTDPIADMLTRIRNAIASSKNEVIIPYSKIKFAIAKIIEREGYAAAAEKVKSRSGEFEEIKVTLKYMPDRKAAISDLRRISKPGRRMHCGYKEIAKLTTGRGIAIISTPKGVMSHAEAQKSKLGGEIICEIY